MSVLDQFKLDGQVVVVTGGGRGIGEAIALEWLRQGQYRLGGRHRRDRLRKK